MSNERTLGSPAPTEAEAEAEDYLTDEPSREITDPTEWAAGIRAIRRSVMIHDAGHLVADFDQLGYRIEQAPEDEDVDDLIDQYEALFARIKGGTRYVVEQRSQDWVRANRNEIIKRHGFRESAKRKLTTTEATTVAYEMIASQVVEPAGVTGDTIKAIAQASPSEADKIANAVSIANSTFVDALEPRDFSSRRSANRAGRASSGS